jgi:hypothetical protein
MIKIEGSADHILDKINTFMWTYTNIKKIVIENTDNNWWVMTIS